MFSVPCSCADRLSFCECFYHLCRVPGYADAAVRKLAGNPRVVIVQAGVGGVRVLIGPVPEIELDDARRVPAHADLQIQYAIFRMGLREVQIALCGGVPACVLDKAIVRAQVHRQGLSAVWALGQQLRGDGHGGPDAPGNDQRIASADDKALCQHHIPHHGLIVPGLLAAGFAALEQAVVALGVEEWFLIYNKITKSNKSIAIISDEKWENVKNEYISNLKNNIKYEVVEEPEVIFEDLKNNDIITNSAVDLFGDIVEVE